MTMIGLLGLSGDLELMEDVEDFSEIARGSFVRVERVKCRWRVVEVKLRALVLGGGSFFDDGKREDDSWMELVRKETAAMSTEQN